MRYRFAAAPALGLLLFVIATPGAFAQSGGGLDGFSLGGSSSADENAPQSLDRIVAVVNNDVILSSELNQAVAEFKQQSGERVDNLAPNVLRSQVLDELILRQLQIQEAHNDGITISKAELQQGVAQLAQRNNMSVPQFQQAVSQSGMSMSAITDRVRDELLISKVRQQEVIQKVGISDADVTRYLQNQALQFSRGHQYHLDEILIDLPTDADTTTVGVARDRLRRLRSQITAGKISFAQAAQKVSDAKTADNGGDMGWVKGSNLPDSFEAALANMSTGQISHVFRGDDGLYLIQLEGQRGHAADEADDSSQKVMVEQANLQHIVLRPNAIRDEAQTKQLADTIRQRIADGEDFSKLAQQYSDDSSTANQGGSVGWIPLNQLAPSTRNRIESLSKGQVSAVFNTGNEFEIVKLNGKRQQNETEQAKRNKARQTLGQQRAAEEGNLWLRKLRDEAYVDIRMPNYQPGPGIDSDNPTH